MASQSGSPTLALIIKLKILLSFVGQNLQQLLVQPIFLITEL